eukprot:905853-Prymnesium_polylepis.1
MDPTTRILPIDARPNRCTPDAQTAPRQRAPVGRPLQPLFRSEAVAAPNAEEAEARLGRGGGGLGRASERGWPRSTRPASASARASEAGL